MRGGSKGKMRGNELTEKEGSEEEIRGEMSEDEGGIRRGEEIRD